MKEGWCLFLKIKWTCWWRSDGGDDDDDDDDDADADADGGGEKEQRTLSECFSNTSPCKTITLA